MIERRYLTVDQAAEQLQTSPEMVRRMLRTGRLHGKRIGSRRLGWRVAASEVERLLAPDSRPVSGPVPRRLRPATPALTSEALTHALAEAEWARRDGDLAEAARWEQIAAGIAQSADSVD